MFFTISLNSLEKFIILFIKKYKFVINQSAVGAPLNVAYKLKVYDNILLL